MDLISLDARIQAGRTGCGNAHTANRRRRENSAILRGSLKAGNSPGARRETECIPVLLQHTVCHAEDVDEHAIPPELLPDDIVPFCDEVDRDRVRRAQLLGFGNDLMQEVAQAFPALPRDGIVLDVALGHQAVDQRYVGQRYAVDDVEQLSDRCLVFSMSCIYAPCAN